MISILGNISNPSNNGAGAGPSTPASNVSGVSIPLNEAAVNAALTPATLLRTETPPATALTAALPVGTKAGQSIFYTSPLGRPVLGLVVDDGSGALSVMLLTDYKQPYHYHRSTTSGADLTAASAAGAFEPKSLIVLFDDIDDIDHTIYVVANSGGLNGGAYVGAGGGAGGGDVTTAQLNAAVTALANADSNEATLRANADTAIAATVTAETTARTAADAAETTARNAAIAASETTLRAERDVLINALNPEKTIGPRSGYVTTDGPVTSPAGEEGSYFVVWDAVTVDGVAVPEKTVLYLLNDADGGDDSDWATDVVKTAALQGVSSTMLNNLIASLDLHTKRGTRAERHANTDTKILQWYETDFKIWWDIIDNAWTKRVTA